MKKMSLSEMKSLTRNEMKKIMAGSGGNSCNVYCGTGSGGSCTDTCLSCEDAGNGSGSGRGQDKMCVR